MQSAFVLHIRPYSESSQLVEIFSHLEGRVSLLVKGSRSRRSSLKGTLQPFTLLNIEWGGKGQLKYLKQLEAQTHAMPLPGDKLYLGLYLNELLYRLLEHLTPYPQLFEVYQECLLALAKAQQYEAILRRFELKLLQAIGYEIDFQFSADDYSAISPQQAYCLMPDMGFVAATTTSPEQQVFMGEAILAWHRLDFSEPVHLRAAKRFCRQLIAERLGPVPLKSRELFRQFKRSS
ncbi:DNA repair protein RecO [Motilimonas pumila]|uniref:DNA repair protein RecO n=1 Tax=Motilimonas pumila TaxID=2303987 RepID=A0A418Y9P4_9GAMM|nr:DNA repair protein RecO [Motilimonas pumila]RJG37974.1 DNA repair protein RecO [Motilimonas pumila]